MNWDAMGAIAELGGAIAVVATIVYLSSQIRQTNRISATSTMNDVLNKFDEFNRMIVSDRSLRLVLTKSEALSEEESVQVYTFTNIVINAWQAVQYAHDNKQIDEFFYSGIKKDVGFALERWPNIRPAIGKFLSVYPDTKTLDIFEEYFQSQASGA